MEFITGRNEVLAKVIFSQACVILSTGGGPGEVPPLQAGTPPPGRHPPSPGRHPPSRQAPPRKFGAGTPPPRKFGAGTPPKNLEQASPPKIWSRHPPPENLEQAPPRKFGAGTPPRKFGAGYGQRSAGTHPTGMHSCITMVLLACDSRAQITLVLLTREWSSSNHGFY